MSVIIRTQKLGFPWPTPDPFLFCAYHKDAYPKGNESLGPRTSLAGRNLGMDFELKDGFRMYHGTDVPGFPSHPHRGFETITLVREGFVDHSDSLGATARFGGGDVQWMTAGSGIVHAEMFPLVNDQAENPVEMFQLWLNLPRKNKLTEPGFTMFWDEDIPKHCFSDSNGCSTTVTTIVGAYLKNGQSHSEQEMPAPPAKSWAQDPENDVAVWTLVLEAGAEYLLPAAKTGSQRVLYFFEGPEVMVAGKAFDEPVSIQLTADRSVTLKAGGSQVQLLLLQGQPISEPVAQHGPFVMNEREELVEAFREYQLTQFGDWPWVNDAPVHAKERGRFAIHIDGTSELPPPAR